MRRALHLGVQKALGVGASHYRVNLGAISTGHVIPAGVDDEVEMNRVDALAALLPMFSPRTSWSFCSQTLLRLAAPSPESNRPFEPFKIFLLDFEPRGFM
jgi:hypothetical protein